MRAPNTDDSPPIDLSFLVRQTHGDGALQRELLALFVDQATAIAGRLGMAASASPGAVAADLHRLRGSALALGATEVAMAVTLFERHAGSAEKWETDVVRLCRAIARACAYAAEIGSAN